MCSLDSAEANVWGFGQTLPMFFLLQPVLTGIGEYYDIKKPKAKDKTDAKEKSSTTNMLSPPPHSPAYSAYSLPMHRISLDLDRTQRLSGDWHRRSPSMVSSPTRISYEMAEQSPSLAASVNVEASRQSSVQKTQDNSRASTPKQQDASDASSYGDNSALLENLWSPKPDRP